MNEIVFDNYNISFVNITSLFNKIYKKVDSYNIELLTKEDINKLVMHFLIINLLEISKKRTKKEKPVFYFERDVFVLQKNMIFLNSFLISLKKLKKFLPVPILILERSIFVKNKTGDLKGLISQLSSFYTNREINSKELKKYLKTQEFYELTDLLSSTSTLKTLIN